MRCAITEHALPFTLVACVCSMVAAAAPPQPLPSWRFTQDGELRGWTANAHLEDASVVGGQLQARAVGADPILLGPVFEMAATATQLIEIRMASDRAGEAELFWTETLQGQYGGFSQLKSVRFPVLGDRQMHSYQLRPFWHLVKKIVRLRFDPPADARVAIERICINDDHAVAHSATTDWRFAGTASGWQQDRGIGTFAARPEGLHCTTSDQSAALISPLVNIPATSGPIVAIRMAVARGTTGTIHFASRQRVGWHPLSFAIRPDGKMHTYNIDMRGAPAWSGQIIRLGLGPTDAADTDVTIESIQVASQPCGPPELEVIYLGSADGVCRTGRPAPVVCQVQNWGGHSAENVSATLSVPPGVQVLGDAHLNVSAIEFGKPQQISWKLTTTKAGAVPIRVELTAPGQAPLSAEVRLQFSAPPRIPGGLAAARYVPAPQPVQSVCDVGAFYFPGWGDATRWQPILDYPMRRPVLGWYDEGNPECADWQIKWAVEHGVDFFLVDWYWSQGKRQLEHWLHNAYLKARYRKHLQWAVMWANHNRPGTHSVADWRQVTQYWIDHYFSMDEYYRIDGLPVVFIWAPANIRRDLGGSNQAAQLYAMSQQMARAAGLPGIYFAAMSAHESTAACRQLQAEGFAAFTSYHTFQLAAARAGHRNFSYKEVVKTSPEVWRAADQRRGKLDYFPLIDTGWDSRPWHQHKARVVYGRTPELFGELCRAARRYADQQRKGIVILGPWNEWGEGSYIEPYAEYGFADLDMLRRAFCGPGPYPPNVVPQDVGRGPYDLPQVSRQP